MTRIRNHLRGFSLAVGAVVIQACSDFLTVRNPGSVRDEELNTVASMPGLVVGMSFDLSRAVDEVLQNSSIMGDDLYHGGSYGEQGYFNRGIILKEDVNQIWGEMHRARWVAEHGIERMKTVLGPSFDSSPLAARAYIYAGLANRLLGEHVCDAVIDGGPKQDFKIHFERAEAQFTEALRIVPNLPSARPTERALRDSLSRVAYGGRASVRAWQGKWADAALDAQQVPTRYVFAALFSTNTPAENNDLAFETSTRTEYTVYNTRWAQVVGDPRVRWDVTSRLGQDGGTPFYQQKKYPDLAADVPLVKGTEMLMLRAEAALRADPPDVLGAMALINEQRAFYDPTGTVLPPLSATTEAEAWPILQNERAAVLWIEGRRFWDLRRWLSEPPPIQNTFLKERPGKCIPVSENEEQSNPDF
jgi:hypothetical protein